ncbi:MAG: glycyl-radical enzyme activating protein [Firmicutes bacterium HGW-Firmicutes-4]|jgi:pyruvate formate lyase activating enzyme|uniref:Glycyl-radical enzyme activating protein n=1 Tax=Acetobacterium malicum TaxID=52692 RepID=A0ABR6Z2U1_9FIRM|nr:glycyl-radical enzyme activating protein [Acetobacterium malicum]MBC3901681.1 glycyl-radical enzyme activating protein [Acetobacterium malicum]MDK2937404.1 pyruvate formate lyase activating enzyme [Eubacteriaceae bacterium]MDK2978246.1 pyruvate formate lyase activating enzyme [Bacteroidales bacterium]PKM60094.1 MAG: glycyl-radical enzyme activating protein [Firmicutes bacterium HGW-Firmicutes-4]
MPSNTLDLQAKGVIFDIQRFSVHDGPGIRTIVFLKGCPLKCDWCSNPESQQSQQELMFIGHNCIGCSKCLSVCPAGAIDMENPSRVIQKKCTHCGKCVEVCYAGALNMAGEEKTVEMVLSELKKDAIYYRNSGGGITFSGGEPFFQQEFFEQLLMGCRSIGWHTTIETTGVATEKGLNRILPLVDLVFMDIKHMDDQKHQLYTGTSNKTVLKNAKIIAKTGVPMIVRIPVIPEVNDDLMNIQATADFVRSLESVKELQLMPYHRLGQNKYDYLGREYALNEIKPANKASIDQLKEAVEAYGLKCSIGGS